MAEVVGSSPTLRTSNHTLKPVWVLRVIFYMVFLIGFPKVICYNYIIQQIISGIFLTAV